MPGWGRAGQEPAGGGMAAVMRGRTGPASNLLCLHVVVLLLVRLLRGADDFSNWDLTGFLNVNSFSTLWELLARPEVQFRNPFSFPQCNVGAESVLSAVLFRILAHVSLYWAPVVVLLVYDALFLLLLHVLFTRLYVDVRLQHGELRRDCPRTQLLRRGRARRAVHRRPRERRGVPDRAGSVA